MAIDVIGYNREGRVRVKSRRERRVSGFGGWRLGRVKNP
jgi:hypothetical protein